jgi:predicted transposase/invertase (TIGR01784 family)
MPYDNICKYLSEKYPEHFAAWLLGQPAAPVEVLKTELSIEPIRADFVTFLRTQERILHLEFQVEVASAPPLPLRMLDYWVRLYRRYQLPITQVIVLLKATSVAVPEVFQVENTQHRYQILRMWEQDPAPLLQNTALLPLAPLCAAEDSTQLLSRIAEQVSKIETPTQRQEISTCTQFLAGLRFDKDVIRQLFREGIMRESVIYQEILQEGREEGREEGKQAEAIALIMRLLPRRIGTVEPELQERIQELSVPQLEDLAEALLDFSCATDLAVWLQSVQQMQNSSPPIIEG